MITQLNLKPTLLQRPKLEEALQPAVAVLLDSLESHCSRKAYQCHLRAFFRWHRQGHAGQPLSKALLLEYKNSMNTAGLKEGSINVALSVLRKLVRTAVSPELRLLPVETAASIQEVKGMKLPDYEGVWLSRQAADEFLQEVGSDSLRGLRDRALLSVLVGCGLRRREAAALRLEQLRLEEIDERPGQFHWVISNLVGKGRKPRKVPMPEWVKAAVDAWTSAAGIQHGPVFLKVARGGRKVTTPIGPGGVTHIVGLHGASRGVRPHDLRRTFAKLARKGGAQLDQIQQALGHKSITTTMRYIGENLDLANAACDRLGIGGGVNQPGPAPECVVSGGRMTADTCASVLASGPSRKPPAREAAPDTGRENQKTPCLKR